MSWKTIFSSIIILVLFLSETSFLYGYIGDGKGIVINEVQPEGDGSPSNPDWVELYNKATQPVDIAYWIINNQNDTDWDNVDNNLITWKNGSTYNDTSYPHCENMGGTDCLYMIPYDPSTLNDSDPNNDYTLYVQPGCYVVIYNTSGTNDYSCAGDNEIKLYMGLDNKDVFVQNGDDVSLIPYFYYVAYDNNGNPTEKGYIWLVMDYFGWNPGNVSTYNPHPNHCGAISNGSFYEYPTFGGHFDTYADIQNQCDINYLYYYYGIYTLPFNFPVSYSTKAMNPSTLTLHSSYGRVPNGYDSDSTDDFQVVADTPGTTDVDVVYFIAKRTGNKVIVRWKSGMENEIISYNLLGEGRNGSYVRLNKKPIYSKGDSSSYSWIGSCSCNKIMLEVVEYGNHLLHIGPIEVNGKGIIPEKPSSMPDNLLIANGDRGNNLSSGCSSGNNIDLWIWIVLIIIVFKLPIVRKYTVKHRS